MTDFLFANHGSITILTPLTEAAHQWTEEHIPHAMEHCGGRVIEPRYAGPILEGLVDDGLTVSS